MLILEMISSKDLSLRYMYSQRIKLVVNVKAHMTWLFGNKWNVALCKNIDIDRLVQGCSNSSALALGLLQPCIKPSIYSVCDMM